MNALDSAAAAPGTWARGAVPKDRVTVSTIVDTDAWRFLLDHRVKGSVLLPTALQLGLVMTALRTRVGSGVGLSLGTITVEDPVLLSPGSPCTVRVEGVLPSRASKGRFAIRSTVGLRHLSLYTTTIPDDPAGLPGRGHAPWPDLPGDAGLVYPPLFHGPSFQVIDNFGLRGSSLVSRWQGDLPSWDHAAPGSGQVSQLVELLLQSCGVWELTRSGRMMRPSYIERLDVSSRAAEPLDGAWAEVWPSTTFSPGFDGVVLRCDRPRAAAAVGLPAG